MKGAGAWLAVLALAWVGCLLPQDERMLPELERARNLAPRIIGVQPQLYGFTIPLGEGCSPQTWSRLEFRAFVSDPNDDFIRDRWFVDPDQNYSTAMWQGRRIPGPAGSGMTTVEAQPNIIAMTELSKPGDHRLELFVSDGEFTQGIQTLPESVTLLDGGRTDDFKYTDSVMWVVKSDPQVCCIPDGGCN